MRLTHELEDIADDMTKLTNKISKLVKKYRCDPSLPLTNGSICGKLHEIEKHLIIDQVNVENCIYFLS